MFLPLFMDEHQEVHPIKKFWHRAWLKITTIIITNLAIINVNSEHFCDTNFREMEMDKAGGEMMGLGMQVVFQKLKV